MQFIERFSRWEGMVFGFLLGVTATIVGSMAYNEVNGLLAVSQFKRSLHNKQLDRVSELMEAELATATHAMVDGVPLDFSHYLATQYMPKLYAHHMTYAMTLLKNEDVLKFNALRRDTPFLIFNLSQRDFTGLNLASVEFRGAELTGSNFTECNLEGASFWVAEMPRANLTRANVTNANFSNAVMSSAILTGLNGEGPNFEQAVMVDATMIGFEELQFANFSGAELSQANLFQSSFPDARFDGADFTLASAVASDFGQVESMNDVNLTGANLTGARIDPRRVERAWFVNADGLTSSVASGLQRAGGVARPEEVLERVDPRIISGFRAQIEEDDSIKPEEREAVLLLMLQEYYLR